VHEFKFLDSKINEGSNSDTSIAELLSKRLKFIRDHHEFAPLGAYFKYLNSKYGFGLSVGEYTTRFWDVFNVISKTFVDGHVYSYCNYSIRKILVMYFGFIDKLLLNPDSGYKIETILTEKKHVRITKLRNYFYKWLLCSDEAVPPDERNLINIYDYSSPQHMNYHNLNHKILTYLYNRKAIAASSSITLREIEDDFEYFGIKRDHVSAQLMELTNDQDFEEETLIWREISTSPADRDTISFMLMPAGKYFIEKLGSSREYAFWNALDTDIADDLLAEVIKAKKIPYAETFSDRLKLDLVHDFVRLVLYPRLTRELKSLMTSPGRISTHDISKMRKYWQLFGIGGHSYEVSLLISVKDTIDHTSLDRVEQAAYHTKYRDLITLLKASEQTYGLTHL